METPEFLARLVDDAAIFPPGDLPLPRALAEHREHRRSPYADLVGTFVVSDATLPALCDLVQGDLVQGDLMPDDLVPGDLVPAEQQPVAVTLVVSGGAGAVEGAVRWAARAPGISLAALEIALRDEADLAHNAGRVLAAVDAVAEELGEAAVSVEPPRVRGEPTAGWLAALDELAARAVRLKFRTGGLDADAVPTPTELAACLEAALDRELAFKCTAGLHRALRHVDAAGITHHGFLNVLLATRAGLDGADVVAVLEETAPSALLAGLDPAGLARARRWFTSFGSCSIAEPRDDLVELGVITA
ncbi:MAG: hypothetical protein ACTHJH_05875 [Marmoricola sp.]